MESIYWTPEKRGYCGCSCYCDMLSLTVFVMFIFPPTLLPWAHSHFFFLLLSSLLFSLPPSFLFLLSQLEVLHYRLSISSKHHGSPAQSSYQALHAYQVLPSFHLVSFFKNLVPSYNLPSVLVLAVQQLFLPRCGFIIWERCIEIHQIGQWNRYWEMLAKVMEKRVKL